MAAYSTTSTKSPTIDEIVIKILEEKGTISSISPLNGLFITDEARRSIPEELQSGRAFIKHLLTNQFSPYNKLDCVLVYTSNFKQLLLANPKKIMATYQLILSQYISGNDPDPFQEK